ncbi:hypothetical protein HHK36_005369 [Tetracentron sinense]|uniref:Protein kinase domain-containing protein n=1 Tax=Tetracentron sinense TaxID=13715 RepID=A0A834ZKX1_TETSI|nr:hypothetical protein HHK36_005369 [Tetracentron sinense]
MTRDRFSSLVLEGEREEHEAKQRFPRFRYHQSVLLNLILGLHDLDNSSILLISRFFEAGDQDWSVKFSDCTDNLFEKCNPTIQRIAVLYHTVMSCSCFGASVLERKKDPVHAHRDIDGPLTKNIKTFSYNQLRSATNNFHSSNKIGRGGFGIVYKGILKNGIQVAVKALSAESKQGVREFLTEIEIISNVRHPNLVELIGYCVQGTNRILVYEYVENNSLNHILLGPWSKNIKLDWGRRSAICMGTARGLAFLHEELDPPIVHRDIKASNILLDNDFVPKIGDFGLAKLFPENITHISTRVAGTTRLAIPVEFSKLDIPEASCGYLAPEYVLGGQLTKKADVYSFGVLILEIVSGRSSVKATWGGMEKLLLEWTWQLYEEGKLLELVDTELEEYPEEEVLRYIRVALFCTQAAASRRPSMIQVVDMLSRHIQLNEKQLTPPGFYEDSAGLSGTSQSNKKWSNDNSTSQVYSLFPVTITQVIPR